MNRSTTPPPPLARRLPRGAQMKRCQWARGKSAAWQALLSREERARFDGYGIEKRRREFLLGRLAARTLLASVLGCAPADVPLVVAESGAVEVGPPPQGAGAAGHTAGASAPWRLSISHRGREAVAVVARRRVGVDLEEAAPDLDRPARMARFLLAEDERTLLDTLGLARAAAFGLCWALKEATLKALGCGLRRSPKVLRLVDVAPKTGTARVAVRDEGRAFEAAFERRSGTWLAVACEERSAQGR